jgi:hypothetical protein
LKSRNNGYFQDIFDGKNDGKRLNSEKLKRDLICLPNDDSNKKYSESTILNNLKNMSLELEGIVIANGEQDKVFGDVKKMNLGELFTEYYHDNRERQTHDPENRKEVLGIELALRYHPLLEKIAKQVQRRMKYRIELDELISMGYNGLTKALSIMTLQKESRLNYMHATE